MVKGKGEQTISNLKKKIFVAIFPILLLVLTIIPSQAFFVKSHIAWTVDGFQTISSPITEKCRPYLNIVLDGDTGTDVGVLHYGETESALSSYIALHTKGAGYQNCLAEASTDIGKQCMCVGEALHIVQDSFSHLQGGVTEKYLKKFLGTNYFGHMTVERNFENKHMDLLTKRGDYSATSGQLEYYNGIVLNSLFPEFGGDEKYLQLLKDMSGISLENDARIFRSGYLGEGFYNSIYKDKVSLPYWTYLISIGAILLGFGLGILILFIGSSGWKYLTAINWLIIGIIGAIILFSFVTGTTWRLTTFVIEVPPMFGYLKVSDTDVAHYDDIIQQATNQYLSEGVLNIDDATGLTYTDSKTGELIQGALTKAETPFKVIWFVIILPLYLALNIFLLVKTFKRKRVIRQI